eukprot:2807289-Ditylum_brightwellii.AAC.1
MKSSKSISSILSILRQQKQYTSHDIATGSLCSNKVQQECIEHIKIEHIETTEAIHISHLKKKKIDSTTDTVIKIPQSCFIKKRETAPQARNKAEQEHNKYIKHIEHIKITEAIHIPHF